MMSSVSPPITGGPASDLGGTKQVPKDSPDIAIILDPNKSLNLLGVQKIDRESASGFYSHEENEDFEEPVIIIAGGAQTLFPIDSFPSHGKPGQSTFGFQAGGKTSDVSGRLDPQEIKKTSIIFLMRGRDRDH
jgi:hypothetical protein